MLINKFWFDILMGSIYKNRYPKQNSLEDKFQNLEDPEIYRIIERYIGVVVIKQDTGKYKLLSYYEPRSIREH